MSTATNRLDVSKAKQSGNKIINNAKEIQRVHSKLQSSLNSISWWVGDSKSGFVKRSNVLLESLNSTAANALLLGDDLLAIVKDKEEEERSLDNILKNAPTGVVVANTSEGGSKS